MRRGSAAGGRAGPRSGSSAPRGRRPRASPRTSAATPATMHPGAPWRGIVPAPDQDRWWAAMDLTVVIAARDAASTITEQLDALAAQVWDGAWEVLVVDNGSTDRTPAILREAAASWPALRLVVATHGRG